MTWILEHIVYPLFSKMGIERLILVGTHEMSICGSIIDKDSDKKSAIFCMFEYLYITLTRKPRKDM